MIEFEWDTSKARANLRKHGVSFEEAQTVFYDEFARQFFDKASSTNEDRFLMLGMSIRARIVVVVHCDRSAGNIIRIISAREATRAESKHYRGRCL